MLIVSPLGCITGVVRLVRGNYAYQGRVEVCINDSCTVCGNNFHISDAQVICRQLGYSSGNI